MIMAHTSCGGPLPDLAHPLFINEILDLHFSNITPGTAQVDRIASLPHGRMEGMHSMEQVVVVV